MKEVFWAVFELLINALQCFMIVEFYTRYLTPMFDKKRVHTGFFVCWLAMFLQLSVINYLIPFEILANIIAASLLIGYGVYCLNGDLFQKCFVAAFTLSIIAINSIMLNVIFSAILGKEGYSLVITQDINRFIYIIIVNISLFYIFRILLKYKRNSHVDIKEWLILIINPIVSLVAMGCIMELTMYSIENFFFGLIATLAILALNIFTYWLFMKVQKESEKNLQYERLQHQAEKQERSVEDAERIYAQIRMVRHDMKNYNATLLGLLERKDLSEAKNLIMQHVQGLRSEAYVSYTPSKTLNSILNNKVALAHTNDIEMTCEITMSEKIRMKEMDVAIVLGNLLDNAIEFYHTHPEEPSRTIKVSIRQQGKDYFAVCVKNAVSYSILEGNAELKTSKRDKKNHGIGVASVKKIASDYKGTVDIYEENGFFCVSVIFSAETDNEKKEAKEPKRKAKGMKLLQRV